ncbi:uncharacterized protein LOC143921719 isoform X2 [Arctopsyche grandis]|uniref:uncharacterized protein LOC143921719 isoform X2 n=1 Tax=Arctopsyche grandis TaxID=121162 RepID=UPI00406D6C39
MVEERQELRLYDTESSTRRPATYCSICTCCNEFDRSRMRRRCRSEGLERSPYDISAYSEAWPPSNTQSQNFNNCLGMNDCVETRRQPADSDRNYFAKYPQAKDCHDHYVKQNTSEPPAQYGACKQNGDCLNVQSKPSGRLSPYKYNSSKSKYASRNSDSVNRWRDPQIIYASKLIENEEPHLFTVDEYQEKYSNIEIERPKSEGPQHKTPLKSILINNTRRSASPNFFRKTKSRPTTDWSESGEKYTDGRRRVRAHSESESNAHFTRNCCRDSPCCTAVMKRARDESSPVRTYPHLQVSRDSVVAVQNYLSQKAKMNSGTPSNYECNGHRVTCRDVGVGEWSIYDNVTAEPTVNKRSTNKTSNNRHPFLKGKQPPAKIKSRLLAIKAKKALMEAYSTGSDVSEDELSDNEDAASKASMDRDSDMSIEPADQQECLTSDSGPSVSSVSDSASLNGLSSALIAGAVVTPNEDCFASMLRPSLFPHVPPYLKFVSHDATPLRPPSPVQRHLRWKLTTITPVVVRKTLLNSGFKLVRKSMDWVGTWGKHMKSVCFKGLKESQKINHFPGTFQIGRKDRLWRNLHKLMIKYGSKEFGLMPKTYVLPHDLKALKYDWDKYAALNDKWIIKPPASARGTGIKVVARWAQIPKRRPVVVQHYIARPYLINDSKFDMRLYVVVTSIHPLRIYLYPDGLARFASVKYSDENNSLQDRYMHLTNYSINRLSKSYTHNQDAGACQGHKWTLQALLNYLKNERGVNTAQLWNSMKDLVIKTILSGESSISCLTKANIGSRFNCYELFGIDVLLDENLKPWLLEVNISPSLHSASPLDLHVKGPLVSSLLNMAQFHVPSKINMEELQKEKTVGPVLHDKRLYTVHLSKEEKVKHSHFTELDNRKDYLEDILTNLTPDDVRHLIQAEDELTQKATLERIFPTATSYPYLEYMAGPRYYNRLFDAWEYKYGNNRKAGVKRLQELCEQGVHLEVPPMPAKNDEEESGEATSPMQEECRPTFEAAPEQEAQEPPAVVHECSSEGRHIVGELCLICRPAINLLLQNEGQPIQVQQHA